MPVRCVRLVVVPLLMAALVLGVCSEAVAQPRDKCERERVMAENRYLEGFFDEAIALLQPCLGRPDLAVDEAVQIYRLISLAHMNKGDLDQAQQTVRDLLGTVPTYQADPVQDPPSYVTMVTVVRQEIQAQAQPAPEEPVEEPEAEPPAAQPDARAAPPPLLRPDEQVSPPIVSRRAEPRRRVLRTPRSWLLATGGAVVVVAAVALAFGGSAESSPAPPR